MTPEKESLAIDIINNHFLKFRHFVKSLHTTLTNIGLNIETSDCQTSSNGFSITVTCMTETERSLVQEHMRDALDDWDDELGQHFTYNISPVSDCALNISIINNAQLLKEDDLYED